MKYNYTDPKHKQGLFYVRKKGNKKSPRQKAEGLNWLFAYCSEGVSSLNFGSYVDQFSIFQEANPVMLVSIC